MHVYDFAGHRFELIDDAVHWPAQGALLVADLHLEKASWYARLGQYLPPYDSAATLARLHALAERTGVTSIWCLGDSFHDASGPARLTSPARAQLGALSARVTMRWITGNHDSAAELPGERHNEAVVAGVILRHEAVRGESAPELSGHFHPKLRVAGAGRTIARPCFVADAQRMILPAFGALTGGLDAHDPAIRSLFADDARAMIATPARVLHFALPRAPRQQRRASR